MQLLHLLPFEVISSFETGNCI
eukprot:SAG31_NODE_11694_length_1006_cov_1.061742_1_plen_21_part_10